MEWFNWFEDEVVKRVSSWGGFIAAVLLVIGVLTGIFGWVSSKMTRFGPIGWPEAVFIGLVAAAAVILLVCAALITWRLFRPPPPRPEIADKVERFSTAAPPSPELLTAKADVERALKIVLAISRVQRLGELSERLAKATENIEGRWKAVVRMAENTAFTRENDPRDFERNWRHLLKEWGNSVRMIPHVVGLEYSTNGIEASPRYDENPERPIAGEEVVSDPEKRRSFRHMLEKHRSAIGVVARIEASIRQDIKDAKKVISDASLPGIKS